MKFNPVPVIAALLLLSISSQAQEDIKYKLSLKNGAIIPEKNITTDKINELNRKVPQAGGRSFLIIQFETIPAEAQRNQLKQAGIELLDYVPNNAYTATVTGSLNTTLLLQVKARAIVALTPEQKMSPSLASGIYPPWAVKVGGTVDVQASFPKTFSYQTVSTELQQKNIDIVGTTLIAYNIVTLRVSTQRLNELASFPFIEYIQAVSPEPKMLNIKSITDSRANILGSSLAGERNLKGQGIVMGVGDNTDPQLHIDFAGRLIGRAPLPYMNVGSYHGTHVTGTAGGAGNGLELYAGYAPKSRIITQFTSGIILSAPAYVTDDSMVITNNSYSVTNADCLAHGDYDINAQVVDQQAFDLPVLQHVFASGNSGASICSPYPAGFHTVVGGYQPAKNVLTVGNIGHTGTIYFSSSRGPVDDGRIKPEIVALGEAVISCSGPLFYEYEFSWGTSMAAPGVSGGLALLYQRYKQLHGNINPKSGLMKALVCNGGRDRGNTGPDYTYGFGWFDVYRSVTMLENNRYVVSSVANGVNNQHNITVPANTAELKVMLYWHDPPASLISSQMLVNNLDLLVEDPALDTTLPYILDTIPGNVNSAATRGIDNINNIEQVVIPTPVAGTYRITVKGTAVTQNPSQEYFVVYDFVPVETRLTYPIGGERLAPGEQYMIQWDSYGAPANPFTVSYSTNNGASWTDSVVGAGVRQLTLTVPSVNTEQALVRVTRNGTAMVSTSQPFTIVGIPTGLALTANQCEGYISIQWNAVSGATDYEVMMLEGEEMVSKGTTGGTSFVLSGLSKDVVYWVSVRARVNGAPGRRARPVSRQPNNGACGSGISDFDLKIDAILTPVSGRELTSSALSATTTVSIRIKNLDDATVNNFNLRYSVNGGAFTTPQAATNIGGGATQIHNFAITHDFSTLGSYILRVAVTNTSNTDPVPANDTMTVLIKHLPNNAITLITGTDFLDDLESADDSTYYNGQIGLSGADRYDFVSTTTFGRVRPFVNTGIAYSGVKALTLDTDRYDAGGTSDSLKATFNLLPHFGTLDDIRLDFVYKNHGQFIPNNANKVWIRGDDQKPWVEVYDLYANQADVGLYKKSTSIELSDVLAANSQDFSTSFQVRFGQWGQILTADNFGGAGYTFDDIHLYKVDNDLQMVGIDTPVVASCGLNATTPVRIAIRNTADTTISNIPVSFSIDGGAPVNEVIASISGNTDTVYNFIGTGDLSATGNHIVRAWVSYPGDSFDGNDTVTVTVINSQVISSYPYLENFEAGQGGWFTNGKNNSWEYGTPTAAKVTRAASGTKAWKTNLTGFYKDKQLSYLYSPCFDLTVGGMTNPTLSLSLSIDLEDCGNNDGDLCDGAYMEYSADGVTWTRLGAAGQGTNWYNKNYTGNNLWSQQNYHRWHVATIPLPTGFNRLRLRFVVTTDPFVSFDGIGVDDIHIYDNPYGIYDGPPYTSLTVNQPAVNGNSWIDFLDGGKLIASVNPNNQNMGSTNVRAYINTGPVRAIGGQYYHDRDITIKPTTINLADSATVRFYFLDTETEDLINATGCPGCDKPSMAYELGVSKYNNTDTSKENGTIVDNNPGNWLFINPDGVIKVPFDKGYYAEFKVKDFSEFWLNTGGINNTQSLPVALTGFTVKKRPNKDVLAEWKTTSEINTTRFEIELAKGNEEFRQNHFVKIGEVAAAGNSTTEKQYSFVDVENNKYGVRYYRLKTIDQDGRFAYSPVRAVVFDNEVEWQVYPNPSPGIFNLVYQMNDGENLNVKIYNAVGKLAQQTRVTANGFVQKHSIDLQSPQFAPGLYLLEVTAGEKKQVFRLIKQ